MASGLSVPAHCPAHEQPMKLLDVCSVVQPPAERHSGAVDQFGDEETIACARSALGMRSTPGAVACKPVQGLKRLQRR